jgi:hypothetical protein
MSDANTKPAAQTTDVAALQTKFTDLKDRSTAIAHVLQGALPMTGRPLPAQEAFLLTLADLKLLEKLLETAESTFNGIALQAVDPDQKPDGIVGDLVELAEELVEAVMDQFGIDKAAIAPAIIKDVVRQIELLETVVVRAEASAAQMTA